jgi:hypothetical protein
MNARFSVASLKEAGKLSKLFALNQYRVVVVEGKRKSDNILNFNPDEIFVVVEMPDEDVVADTATWEGLV